MSISVREISSDSFENYSKTHVLRNPFQTVEYAELMKVHNGYEPIYVGGYRGSSLVSASMILTKPIAPAFKYGYSPRGFLIDYYDMDLVEGFTTGLKELMTKKNIVFVKINPEVIKSVVDPINSDSHINIDNNEIFEKLEDIGYLKLKQNIYFESLLPRFTPIVVLQNYELDNLEKSIQHRITRNIKKGINLVEAPVDDLPEFHAMIKSKKNRPIEYYTDYYHLFKTKDMIDLLFVEIDNGEYLRTIKNEYEMELEINNKINVEFQTNVNNKNLYSRKIVSDKKLNELNVQVGEISAKIQGGILKERISSALCIKYFNRIFIVINGYDSTYSKLNPNYLLYHMLFEKYKKAGFAFVDTNGITGDFTDENPYKGLNDFKLSWKPTVYEYFGEYDMIVNKTMYQILLSSNRLYKEFTRDDIKDTSKIDKKE